MLSFFDIQKRNKNKTITELVDEAFSNQNVYRVDPKTTVQVNPENQEQLQPKLEPFKKIKLTKLSKQKK